jgi:4-hydroxy-tetrahydrodipicolinate synthase
MLSYQEASVSREQRSDRLRGVLSPVVTPFDADLRPDGARFVRHCQWLVSQDVGLAVFGTNSEGNSLTVGEKLTLLDRLVEAGLPAARMMPGTGTCALGDTVELTSHAVKLGCGGVLMLPPFYYKGNSDEGLFRSYSEVIQRVGDNRLRIYLYHIPPVAQVPITLTLIERLLKAYPVVIAGVKDSSGDWSNTNAMLERFQPQGFDVFSGSESFLLATLRGGGAGCISATANVNPGPIARLAGTWQQDDADVQQAGLDAVRNVFQSFPMIPALKTAIAHYGDDPAWATVRPPLVELDTVQQADLITALDGVGFTMPGLAVAAR